MLSLSPQIIPSNSNTNQNQIPQIQILNSQIKSSYQTPSTHIFILPSNCSAAIGDVLLPRNDGSSTSTAQIITIQSDNSSLSVGLTLTETNYSLWSQVMEMRIAAREKLGYLTCDTPKPLELSSTYNK